MLLNHLLGLLFLGAIFFVYFKFCHEDSRDFILLALGLMAITNAQQLGGSLLIVRFRHFVPIAIVGGVFLGWKRIRNNWSFLLWVILAVFLLFFSSFMWHSNPSMMFDAKLRHCSLMILSILAGNKLATAKDVKKLFVVLLPTVMFVAFVILTGQVDVSDEGRMSINEVNQNALGVSGCFVAVISLGFFLYVRTNIVIKAVVILMSAFGMLKCAQSGSRSAVVAALGAGVCMLFPFLTVNRRFLRRNAPMILLVAAGAVALIMKLDIDLYSRLTNFGHLSGREVQWEDMFVQVKQGNPLLGTGGWCSIEMDGKPHLLGALNIYVDYYYNCGRLGFVVGLAALFLIFFKSITYFLKLKSDIKYPIFALCVVGLLHGFGEDGAMRFGNLIGTMFQLGIGLLSGLSMRNVRLYDMKEPLKSSHQNRRGAWLDNRRW